MHLYIHIFISFPILWLFLDAAAEYHELLRVNRLMYIAFPCFTSTAAVKRNAAWNKSELLTFWLLGRVNQFSKKVLIDFIQESNSLDRGLSGEKSDLLLFLSVSLYRAAESQTLKKNQSKPEKNNWKQCQKKKKVLRNYQITYLEKNKGW